VSNARWLNVRSGPGVAYDIVAVAEMGDRVVLTGYRNVAADWITIRLDSGQEGWVHVDYIDTGTNVKNLTLWTNATETPGGS
jgi:uncharacterized protein YraI